VSGNVVEAHGITKAFGQRQVLQGIDVVVPRGSVVALLGPNGAGKTTTVRILTTLLKPDGGTVTVAGHDALREPDAVRRRIGVAGQTVTLDVHLTGRQSLRMIGRLYRFGRREARRRADELIERFRLADAADRPVQTYSGGMRRRLDLAASLVAAPPVLFLDEPTTGLDPESRATAWDVIRGLVRDGATLLLTTQYLEEADQLADTATIIDGGRILTSDTPERLKRALGGERLDVTLADPDAVAAVPALVARALARDGRTLAFAIPEGERGMREVSAILEALVDAEVAVESYAIQRPTLEQAFLQLVGGRA
jgi:ABC-2 type transport system ATP-binding protein